MSYEIKKNGLRGDVHRAIAGHFAHASAASFCVEDIKRIIRQESLSDFIDDLDNAVSTTLIEETIREHIRMLWRNGASHTFIGEHSLGGILWHYKSTSKHQAGR
jgi:hypothetical protein